MGDITKGVAKTLHPPKKYTKNYNREENIFKGVRPDFKRYPPREIIFCNLEDLPSMLREPLGLP
jgi:hypothetical protein